MSTMYCGSSIRHLPAITRVPNPDRFLEMRKGQLVNTAHEIRIWATGLLE